MIFYIISKHIVLKKKGHLVKCGEQPKIKKASFSKPAFPYLQSHSHLRQEAYTIQRFIRLEHYKFIQQGFQLHQLSPFDGEGRRILEV